MENINIQIRLLDSIDSNILSVSIYNVKNQLIYNEKKIKFGSLNYIFPLPGMYKLKIIICKNKYVYTIWENIYITKNTNDRIYLFLNLASSIKRKKKIKLIDQNYKGLPIEKGEIKLWQNSI